MKYKVLISIFCLALTFFAINCGPRSDNTTPEMAQKMLKLRGYNFNDKEFFRGIRMEDGQVVKAFLQGDINPNAKNDKGETALVYAIREKDPKIAKILIEQADINMQDDRGNSPLHSAITFHKDKIVDLLLEKNVDVNVTGAYRTVKNQTPLYQAMLRGEMDLVKKLLEKKADPNISDSDGSFPLAEIAIKNNEELEIIKLLVEKGADVNKQESNGSTALIYVASNKALNAKTRLEIVKFLLEKGADKSIKNKKGQDALYWAKKMGNDKVAELLK